MRFVIFDDETMEPITVVNLPGVAERDIWEKMNGRVRVPVPRPFSLKRVERPEQYQRAEAVGLRCERFVRNGVVSLMCFIKEAELAMLLDPDFLPGQRREVRDLRETNDRLTSLLLSVIAR